VDWPLHKTGQSRGTPDADIDAPESWSIITAIIDDRYGWDAFADSAITPGLVHHVAATQGEKSGMTIAGQQG
jgi:hypothetical protein